MQPNRLLQVSALLVALFGASTAAQAQATPADTLRQSTRPQLNTLPPANRPAAGPAIPYQNTLQVSESVPPLTLGISLGWGAPYGFGLEAAYRVLPALDANVGIGLGSSGGKIGVGTRAYLPSRGRNHLFAGTNLVYSSSEVAVDVEDTYGVKGRYVIHSSTMLHLRAGLHHQFRRNALQFALGYGAVLSPNPVVELLPGYGPGSANAQNLVELVGPGGLEISVSFLIGLGPGKVTVR
ncbi:hypothetical protein [Hymenobacter cellulosivorans]|uniref:Outer membrane protein beta-barrel domain-containing protein n=1 Tax=Hymenobacter cellulosivorans TaxID=2932249 RepID=A0ABY4FC36_9BACT|nr:hypothetical protein [Hymenobacter cellulosivorans]UOQ54234.1 hypothetical protein MUN80_05630 [Hymenobacter cellulosivorans]